jgi:hypothetical protein
LLLCFGYFFTELDKPVFLLIELRRVALG